MKALDEREPWVRPPEFLKGEAFMPLLSALFLLLVVGVVLALGEKTMPAPPTVKPGQAPLPTRVVELRVAVDLKLALGGKPIEHQELISVLKTQVAETPGLGVKVLIPPAFPAARLLELMAALDSAGVRSTAVEALQAEGGSPAAAR